MAKERNGSFKPKSFMRRYNVGNPGTDECCGGVGWMQLTLSICANASAASAQLVLMKMSSLWLLALCCCVLPPAGL